MYYHLVPLSTPISLLGDAHRDDEEHNANAESSNACYGRLLKKANGTQTVMPNSFRYLMNSTHQETLKQVQGDKKSFSTACSNVNQAHQQVSIISYEAPRPQAGASRKGSFLSYCAPLPRLTRFGGTRHIPAGDHPVLQKGPSIRGIVPAIWTAKCQARFTSEIGELP